MPDQHRRCSPQKLCGDLPTYGYDTRINLLWVQPTAWDLVLFPNKVSRLPMVNLGRLQFLKSMFSAAIACSFVALLPLSSEGACRCEGYGLLYSNSFTLARILNPRPQPSPALPMVMMCSSISDEERCQTLIFA